MKISKSNDPRNHGYYRKKSGYKNLSRNCPIRNRPISHWLDSYYALELQDMCVEFMRSKRHTRTQGYQICRYYANLFEIIASNSNNDDNISKIALKRHDFWLDQSLKYKPHPNRDSDRYLNIIC